MTSEQMNERAKEVKVWVDKILDNAPDGITERIQLIEAAKPLFAKAGFSHEQCMLMMTFVSMMDMMRMQDTEGALKSALLQIGITAEFYDKSTAH